MKLRFMIFIAILIYSCDNHVGNNQDKDGNRNRQFQSTKLTSNLLINQFSGDSVAIILNEKGDTIETGNGIQVRPIPIMTDSIHPILETPKTENSFIQFFSNVDTNEIIKPSEYDFYDEFVAIRNTSNLKEDSLKLENHLHSLSTKRKLFELPDFEPIILPEKDDLSSLNTVSFSVANGLKMSRFDCAFKDSRGLLWFGGQGLTLYNGNHLIYFANEDLFNEYGSIESIIEDRDGRIWMGGSQVYVINGKTITKIDSIGSKKYTFSGGLKCDNQNNIWAGIIIDQKSYLIKIDEELNVKLYGSHYGIPVDALFMDIEQDKKGNILISTFNYGIFLLKENKFNHLSERALPSNCVWKIFKDKNNRLWIASSKGIRLVIGRKIYPVLNSDSMEIPNVRSLTEDFDGNLWAGTNGEGVYKINFKRNFIEQINLNGERDLNSIWGITTDDEHNVWLATFDGLSVIKKYPGYKSTSEISFNTPLSAYKSKDGKTYVGAYSKLFEIVNGTAKGYEVPSTFFKGFILNITEDSKRNIWFSTPSNITKFDGKQFLHYSGFDLKSEYFGKILIDSKDRKWISTDKDLILIEDDSIFRFGSNEVMLAGLSGLVEINDKTIWFSSYVSGLIRYEDSKFTCFSESEGLPTNSLNLIKRDSFGRLIIGTRDKGLCIIDNKTIYNLTSKDGLYANEVSAIEIDVKGNIWVVSNNIINNTSGINKLTLCTDEQNGLEINLFPSINYSHGLQKKTVDCTILDGNIIYLFSNGFPAMIDLDKLDYNNCKLKLDRIYVNEVPVNNSLREGEWFNFDSLSLFYKIPVGLKLNHNQNHIKIDFSTTTNLTAPGLKYTYKMMGSNDSWSLPNSNTYAEYRGLAPGSYTFMLKVVSRDGKESKVLYYTFVIYAPWWLSVFAKISYVIGILIIIVLIFRWRTSSLRKRQRELQEQVNLATQEIRQQKEEVEIKNHEIISQKHIVDEKNKEILDSITYAKRIQTAILPPAKLVKEYLTDSFILYLPKDIVAGDFYWMDTFNGNNGEKWILFAAADCTGHGVPGAMISVVCHNCLNRAVRERGLYLPGEILDAAREMIVNEFMKGDEEVKDGMDISLCALDYEGQRLLWSGANNPLWILREDKFIEYKPNKQPVGLHFENSKFTSHEILIQKGDQIYIFTDGFQDQFGGEKGKKFKASNLKELILKIKDLPMERKKDELKDQLFLWKGELEQVDDITIIGLKI